MYLDGLQGVGHWICRVTRPVGFLSLFLLSGGGVLLLDIPVCCGTEEGDGLIMLFSISFFELSLRYNDFS